MGKERRGNHLRFWYFKYWILREWKTDQGGRGKGNGGARGEWMEEGGRTESNRCEVREGRDSKVEQICVSGKEKNTSKLRHCMNRIHRHEQENTANMHWAMKTTVHEKLKNI